MKSNPARTGSRALLVALVAGLATQAHAGPGSVLDPQGVAQPTYYANSPQLRKFVDTLPGLGPAGANNLGSYLPVAVPDTTTYQGSDYYEIAIVEWEQRLHSDLQKPTKLRGYVQKIAGVNGAPMYLGPVIVAHRDRPVRVKVFNELQTGIPFFIPVDATVMGAGKGNLRADGVTPCDPLDPAQAPLCASYSEQRVGVHLHGGLTPWISDGLPHQWIAPAGETSPYKAGVGARDVPDMNPPDAVNYLPSGGAMTLYYPNQQSGRLMFYHDHAYGLTRLNVYAGVAAAYLLRDDVETALTADAEDLPLVVQDKSFVPSDIAVQDSKWDLAKWGAPGDLWFPHMYEENQDPTCSWDINCMNPLGRWDYGPWIWPPVQLPGNPVNPSAALTASIVPEAFMDVMMVNGTVYPKAVVQPKAYRLRILNASNDRFLNLQLYYAIKGATFDPTRKAYFDRVTGTPCIGAAGTPAECTEVAMVPRNGDTYTTVWGDESTVPFDGRPGGVPNPVNAGPKMYQIATEGGLLPNAVLKNAPPIPVTYDTDPKSMTVGNVIDGTLILGPAERAEVVVDFSQVPAGSTLILYNDAPAAFPAGDQRYDYYTFGPDWTDAGGAPSPQVGTGPNTRTVMQFVVQGTPAPAYDFAALQTNLPAAYAASQEKPLIPEPDYRAAGFPGMPVKGQYGRINMTTSFSYTDDTGVVRSLPIHQKAIAEEFDPVWGRMSAVLGTEAMIAGNQGQNTFGFMYVDPATEVVPQGETQIWKLTHNGVDTHAIHFHLLNVQVVNRVDWAGVVKPPDPNEVGWKETVRMNPLEDIILAVRAMPPKLPFTVPNSKHVRDVTRPTGVTATANQMNFTTPWPYEQPQGTTPAADPGTTTTNDVTDYGWEYVWHCHLLGHEENDMMRPLVFTNVTNYNTADVFAPTITANPANGATIFGPTVITLSVTDAAAGRPKYLDTGVVAFSYTVNGGAPVVVNGTTATINPPAGGWTGDVVVTATATDAAAVPNVANVTFNYTRATLASPTLTAPVNPVTVQGATRNVTIRWTYPAGQGQTGFAVERAPVVGGVVGAFVQVATPNGSPYTNQLPAIPNTQALALQWVFRVVALQNALRSPPSNLSALVTQLPISPTSPNGATATANAANPRQLTVGWNDRSLNEAGFTIWRQESATGNGGWAGDTAWDVPAVAGISPPARTYVDTGLTTGRFYRYRVQAFNAGGSTAYSAYSTAVRAP